ncbi:MAG: DUF4153 domain-containing protein [Candidatus Kapabacteria bacterium]|nr:DUF4153 domain-containing protein [Candidatus Kapabacteria bacterium]
MIQYSVKSAFHSLTPTFKRFPFAILSAIIATIIAIYSIEYSKESSHEFLTKIMMISYLGISLFSAYHIFTECRLRKIQSRSILLLILIILLIIYYFNIDLYPAQFYRFWLFVIATHSLFSISFSARGGSQSDFWQFNKTVLLRLLLSGFYVFILWSGLSLAIAAIENLFNVHWSKEIYQDNFIFLTGFIGTIIFLSGIPTIKESINAEIKFNKALKVFVQYILFGISGLYLIILYVYLFKILISWQLPNGWVSSLVSVYGGLGILVFLFLYPLRADISSKWIKAFLKWFFITMVPLLLLMSIAIITRISAYGITENRYFMLLINFSLYLTSFYFIFLKNQNIRLIPIALAIISFLSVIGPWSAISISEASQINRLDRILSTNGRIIKNKIVKNKVEGDVYNDISSIINYLEFSHKLSGLKKWLSERTDFDRKLINDSLKSDQIINSFLIYTKSNHRPIDINIYKLTSSIDLKNINDYNYLIYYNYDKKQVKPPSDNKLYKIGYQYDFNINKGSDSAIVLSITQIKGSELSIKYSDILDSLNLKIGDSQFNSNQDQFLFKSENQIFRVMFLFTSLNVRDDNINSINSFRAGIYIKLKSNK